MSKIKLVALISVLLSVTLWVSILVLEHNNSRIEHINDQLTSNPPAAGDGRSFGDVQRARAKLIDTTAGLRTKTATRAVYKVTEGNVTSFSDVPTRNFDVATGRAEIIQVQTTVPTPPTTIPDQQEQHSQWESQFAMFPQDQNGWSIIKPAVDSRLIYVSSSSGNDSKAQAYFSKDIADPRNPPANTVAFKTIGEALKLQRDGYPDWVLLKKGDEWQIDKGLRLPSGRSSSAPVVITSYGNSSLRPVIKTGIQPGIVLLGSRNFISIIGIEFYANQRDPDSVNFIGWSMVARPVGFQSISGDNKEVESLTLEDNIFRYFAINLQFNGASKHKNIVVRRNMALNAYSTSSHSQGIFADNVSILLEENLFDHNGWYQQSYENNNSQSKGQATYFNHSTYLVEMSDTVIKGNIFSNSSSIGIKLTSNGDTVNKINHINAKNIIIDDNLIIGGEVGISAGGNKDFNNGFRWQNMTITNNVLLNIGNSQPTRRTLAWYVNANDWDGGVVSGNYLLCNKNSSVTNVWGISVEGLSRNISVLNNIIYGIKGNENKMITTSTKEKQTGLIFKDNAVSQDASCESLSFSHDNVIVQFISAAKEQSFTNWNPTYTASKFNGKIKAVFVK